MFGSSLGRHDSINGLQTVLRWQESTVSLLSRVSAPTVFSLALKFVLSLFPGNLNLAQICFSKWHLVLTNKLFFICRFHAQDLEVKLSDELPGSLRQLKVRNKLKFSLFRKYSSFMCNECFGLFSYIILSTVLGSIESFMLILSFTLILSFKVTQCSLKAINASGKLIVMKNSSFYLTSLCFWIMLNLSSCSVKGFYNLCGNWALVWSCIYLLQCDVSAARGQCSHWPLQESAKEESDWTPRTSQVRAQLMVHKLFKYTKNVLKFFKCKFLCFFLGSRGNTSWSMWRRGLLERSLSLNTTQSGQENLGGI